MRKHLFFILLGLKNNNNNKPNPHTKNPWSLIFIFFFMAGDIFRENLEENN